MVNIFILRTFIQFVIGVSLLAPKNVLYFRFLTYIVVFWLELHVLLFSMYVENPHVFIINIMLTQGLW